MKNSDSTKGVLDENYIAHRRRKKEFISRYKVRARIVAQAIQKYLRNSSNLKILDFGSAEGLTILEMNSILPCAKYVGIEYSKILINHAPKLPSNIRIVRGNVMSLPEKVKNEKYDVVCALALLEHLPEPVKALKEAASVLRPGGIFIATSPHPIWDKISSFLGLLDGKSHVMSLTRGEMNKLAKQSGMKVVSYQKFMWAPIGFLAYLKIFVPPSVSLGVDRFFSKLHIFDFLFVNQCFIAQKVI